MNRTFNYQESGTAALELVISVPILLIILWAIVTFGTALHARTALSRAAEDAARSISFFSAAQQYDQLASSVALADCDSLTQQSVKCEALSSLSRSLLLTGESESERLEKLKRITRIEANPGTCGAGPNALGIKISIPFEAIRILPPLPSLFSPSDAEWFPTEISACAVAYL